jgi:hypothetical protein
MQWLRRHLREHIKSPVAPPAAATDNNDALSAILRWVDDQHWKFSDLQNDVEEGKPVKELGILNDVTLRKEVAG